MSTPILILILVISTVECRTQASITIDSVVLLETGDACVDLQNGVKLNGLCMPIQNCSSILSKILAHQFDFIVCRYEGIFQIVCCTNDQYKNGIQVVEEISIHLNQGSFATCPHLVTSRERLKRGTHFKDLSLEIQAVGGTAVNPGEYTHMAALGYKLNQAIVWKCGGSLISDRYVLTAGHCLTDRNIGSVHKVRLGALKLLNDDWSKDFDVARLIPHPEYNPKFVYNDIGLIELADQVVFNYHIQPICLPPSTNLPQTYKSMGWGATGYAEYASDKLLKVDQELFSYEECQNQYNVGRRFPNGIMNDSHICAGSRDSIQGTCQGDSGGPLLSEGHFNHQKLLYIYGIVSFGSACGFINSPGVYTKVFPYVKWIEQTIYGNIYL